MFGTIARSKATPLLLVSVVALGAFALSCANQESGGPGTTATPAAMTQADSIALGRRMNVIGGCNDCHTPGVFYGAPDTTRLLSGSELGWRGPWGTTYARNLTPDVATGLGSWSADDIVRAIRVGQRPDGSALLPPMPWPNYASFTDLEAYSLAAYLKSLPAITHQVPAVVRPGGPTSGAALVFPPPPAWDVPPAQPVP